MIPIDKGVPLATDWRGSKERKYPWGAMEVGDSFFAPGPSRSAASQASVACKRHDRKYTTRRVTENGVAGTRVWRIK